MKFYPIENKLERLDGEKETVIINSPASRCLLMLLKQQGNILSQQSIMDEVWQKQGIFVAPNTYYQNISILRKGLKKVGLGSNIVITIPRIGLSLSKNIDIRIAQSENEMTSDAIRLTSSAAVAFGHPPQNHSVAEPFTLPQQKNVVTPNEQQGTIPVPEATAGQPLSTQKHEKDRATKGSFFLSLPALSEYTLLKFNIFILSTILLILLSSKIMQLYVQAHENYKDSPNDTGCIVLCLQIKS